MVRKTVTIYNKTDSDLRVNPTKYKVDQLIEPGTSEVLTLQSGTDISVHSKYGSYILSVVSDLGGLSYYRMGDLVMNDNSAFDGTVTFL